MKRIVLITRSTTGIGAVTAQAFQAKGYQVVANYAFDEAGAEAFHQKTGIAIYKWDVTDADACLQGVQKIAADMGTVDVLVNNASATPAPPAYDPRMTDGVIRRPALDGRRLQARTASAGCAL